MPAGDSGENPDYLANQLITCIGNKRALLGFIDTPLRRVKQRLGKHALDIADLFAGSGIVSRYFKAHATRLISNDLEEYARILGKCYLTNAREVNIRALEEALTELLPEVASDREGGFISELYAPAGGTCFLYASQCAVSGCRLSCHWPASGMDEAVFTGTFVVGGFDSCQYVRSFQGILQGCGRDWEFWRQEGRCLVSDYESDLFVHARLVAFFVSGDGLPRGCQYSGA
jgi:hypothetical protein